MKKILNFFKKPFRTSPFTKVSILLLLLSFLVLLNNHYKIFKIDGQSMHDTLGSGDVVLVNRQFYENEPPERGDVVVCLSGDEVLIKRIIGTPGDTVEIIEGYIIVNGSLYEDEFGEYEVSFELLNDDGEPMRSWADGEPLYFLVNEKAVRLGPQEYWVIGDNRAMSWYGKIDENDIVGKVYGL